MAGSHSDRKLELWSTVLEKLGYDPLPYFKEPGESPYSTPELYKEYPLVMTSGFPRPVLLPAQYRKYSLVAQFPWFTLTFQRNRNCQQAGN